MATRRTTRRSIGTSNENDLVALGNATTTTTSTLQVKGGKSVGIKGGKISATIGNKEVGAKASTSTTTTTNATRKRTAFNDVTNESKTTKASSLNPSKVPQGIKKPLVLPAKSLVVSARRTRSSTGGLDEDLKPNIKLEEGEESDVDEEEEVAEENVDAMEEGEDGQQQENLVVVPVAPRVIKQLRKSTTKSTAPIATSKPARKPLESKSTNSTISTTTSTSTSQLSRPTHSTKAKAAATRPRTKSVPTAEAIRLTQRRLAAELQIKAAQEELEVAKREEEAHKDKKARTSPSWGVDHSDDLDLDVEEEEEEEMEMEERQMELKVRPKDYGWEDLDDGDEEDPLMVSAYVVEVYDYLKELELTTMPEIDYMTNQNEVTWKMRGILIDWLIEIHTKFRLLPETIFLATNIVDRFLSSRIVSLVKFQLVGVTALFIASKYEEVVCPSVSNFLYMTDGGYEDDEILKAERYVLSTIDFNLSYPNPINFLRRISKADGYDISSRTMAKYLMEISVVDHKFMGITPSLIAAAGNWLARKVLGKGSWHANLVHYSGYTEEELKPTAQLMLDYVVRNSSLANGYARGAGVNPLQTVVAPNESEHPNFIKKYSGKKFFKASTIIKQWAEDEYAPIETIDPKTRKLQTRLVPAIL